MGSAAAITIPKGARVIDCTGKFLIPGLVDGFAGMNSQGQANANLYMGVTTVVARSDDRRGFIDFAANPSPHLYLHRLGRRHRQLEPAGQPAGVGGQAERGRASGRAEPRGHRCARSTDTAQLGTRVLWLGHNLTAANTQWIIAHAHQMGLVTYGEFVSTPYRVGIEAGVDALLHMSRYELGVIPDELQRPLVDDPEGPAANTAYDYSERVAAHRSCTCANMRSFWPRIMPR